MVKRQFWLIHQEARLKRRKWCQNELIRFLLDYVYTDLKDCYVALSPNGMKKSKYIPVTLCPKHCGCMQTILKEWLLSMLWFVSRTLSSTAQGFLFQGRQQSADVDVPLLPSDSKGISTEFRCSSFHSTSKSHDFRLQTLTKLSTRAPTPSLT